MNIVGEKTNENPLQMVDFISSDGKFTHGLVPVSDRVKRNQQARHAEKYLSIDERAAVHDAALFEHIDYIFFRRFSQGRSSHIAAYIVDNTTNRLDKNELAKLHKKVWLHGTAPLLYVFWPGEVDILACARGADFWQRDESRYNPAINIKIAGRISHELKKFSAYRLGDGTFWEDTQNRGLADHVKAAHQILIQAVIDADKDLDGENNPILRRLLLLFILIKYLEDRGVFPQEGWFGRFHRGARSFFDVLNSRDPDKVYQLLKYLDNKFNGDVFGLPRDSQWKLTKKGLETLATLIESKTQSGGQRYLWERYSFEYLPVEIISHLYQHFIQDGHGAVYTPPFLAGLLLDQVMPYEKLNGNERVLDPACGSGVFLVGAFRRLINVWRSKRGWNRPDVETLKAILRNSIYGIEMDAFAVDLTAFSLSLAICDALKPDVIWNELRFDKLRDANLIEADFFQVLLDSREGRSTILDKGLDVVVGNPPFESKLTVAGNEINKVTNSESLEMIKSPGNQVAYLFLNQAMSILKDNGSVCLIQPAGMLYNSKVKAFRESFFKRFHVRTILDFSSIRNLFEADTKTIAVHSDTFKPNKNHCVQHWTFRRTNSVHERICFELDHYDMYSIPQTIAERDHFIWRVNLLGGGRLYNILRRLRQLPNLADFIEDHKKDGWDYGEGFKVGTKKNYAPLITGKPYLPTTAFTDNEIDENRITIVTETHFENPHEKRFMSPLILIKENSSLPIKFWNKGIITYNHKIIGIHAQPSQYKDLRELYEMMINRREFYRFYLTLNSSQYLVGRATAICKQDIDQLPLPTSHEELDLAFWEKAMAEDVLKYMADYIRLGQNSDLLEKAASKGDLKLYADLFVRMLGSIYDNLKSLDTNYIESFICQSFYFGDKPDFSFIDGNIEDSLRNIIYHQQSEYMRKIRVLRYYDKNVMIIIKPDRLRYWIRSTAIRDADDTLTDLREQGY
ncbi:N-6 DNA methylase [Candidatus Sumerlaeota bacterium]|nr:N-6 DNA methylase [Candidatus Sumerlaeota bacterium]